MRLKAIGFKMAFDSFEVVEAIAKLVLRYR
jgi:hypothetical protein